MENVTIGRQLVAGRAVLNMSQKGLAEAAKISVPTLRRMEKTEDICNATSKNIRVVVLVLEGFGIEFIDRGVSWLDRVAE